MLSHEPDFRTASNWWEDLPQSWTPLGWRESLFRFNVLWNGTLFAQPWMNRRTTGWDGQGLQLGFAPHGEETFVEAGHPYLYADDRQVRQGWAASDAPLLWTEWSRNGVLFRQSVFAHLPGDDDTRAGDEPLYAWLRLTIHALCPALPLEARYGVHLLFHATHLRSSMERSHNVQFAHDLCQYPRALHAETTEYDPVAGLRILEDDGRLRLAVAPGAAEVTAHFEPPNPQHQRPAYRLYLSLPARQDASVDLLVPIIPVERAAGDAELAMGYDAALAHANAYWRHITATPTQFRVPEAEIGEAITHSVRFSNVLTERNPDTGKRCKVNGSWTYADLWTTPGAMDLAMMMDHLGHHAMVARYLDIFREEQGTVVPPGAAYTRHPGYLSTPALYKSIDWLSDNGAVLWMLCTHYLLSGDRAYLARFLDCILASCDWITEARAKTGHGGYAGVLPPAVATDAQTKIQGVWNIGWNYKGLCAAVRVLEEIDHPHAAEFAAEAEAYRTAFVAAFRDKCAGMPTWTDHDGRQRRFVPTALAGDEKAESRHAFYLDTGPLFLVFAGLLPADDPLMEDTLAWFREGPQTAFYRRESNCWQVPVLDHEISSCEPCYSWNIFHAWQRGDRERYLEGMYSLFAGALSRQTWISCETRGGITGTVFASPLAIYLARLAVVDDQLAPGDLHLLRLMPRAWLKPGDTCACEQLPTAFGPLTLQTAVSADGDALTVTLTTAFRRSPRRIIIHTPPGISRMVVNGAAVTGPETVLEGVLPHSR